MKTIFKYEVELKDEFDIQMPYVYKVLSVQVQNGVPYIWAIVDPDMDYAPKKFYLRGTGHPFNIRHDARFIGTFQLAGAHSCFIFLRDSHGRG